ncbi:MAG: O-antigen ligase family protein [Erysipelotrichaceae bacterium]
MRLLSNQSVYKLFFVVAIFFNTLHLQGFGMTINPLIPLALVWGVGLLGFQIVRKEVAWKRYGLGWLTLYLGCVSIGTMTNPFQSSASWQLLLLQALIFFLLFANANTTSKEALHTEMLRINTVMSLLMFAASGVSIALFLGNVSYNVNGVTLGLVGNRLFGVYFNPNPASFLAIMAILFSLMAIGNPTKYKPFYVGNIVVQVVYILLSNCRMALLILWIIGLVLVDTFFLKRKQYPLWRQVSITLLVSVGFFYGTAMLKDVLFWIPQAQGAIFEEGGRFQMETLREILLLAKTGVWASKEEMLALANDVSSGRIELYLNALHAWRLHPLFGIGMGTFTQTLRFVNPGSAIMQFDILHAHNVFLESLVSAGIVGFVAFGSFVLKSAKVMRERLRTYEYDATHIAMVFIALVVFVDFAGSLLDYGVFYVYTNSSVLFWVYLGYLFANHKQTK